MEARLTQIAFSTRSDHSGNFSPDGSKVAFVSNRTGERNIIWISDLDGQNPRRVSGDLSGGSPYWSPSGMFIAFNSFRNESGQLPQIWIVRPDGSGLKQLTKDNSGNSMPRWSRDGTWIYFRSDRSGKNQIWKIPLGGGDAVQVTRSGGIIEAMESPDGKWLYYVKNNDVDIWRMLLPEGEETRIEMPEAFLPRRWVVVEDGIYYMRKGRSEFGVNIEFLNLETQKTRVIEEIEGLPSLFLDYSPDRSSLLFTMSDWGERDIMLIENFK
jgi:Tol biopolymer transport system component